MIHLSLHVVEGERNAVIVGLAPSEFHYEKVCVCVCVCVYVWERICVRICDDVFVMSEPVPCCS
jgi:hypothetical protein